MPQKFMISHCLRVVAIFLLVSFCFSTLVQSAQHSPEIADGLVWINSARPLKIKELKGKFVIVYFWNYGIKNIQSLVTQCRELQEKYPTMVVVIGVHTGRALNNDVLNDHVVNTIGALRIKHPVTVDNQTRVLKDFHLQKFPSAVLLAPDGEVLFKKIGSDNLFYFFNKLIEKNIPQFQNQLDLTIHDFQKIPEASIKPDVQPADDKDTNNRPEKLMQPGLSGNAVLDEPKGPLQPVTNNIVSKTPETVDNNTVPQNSDSEEENPNISKPPLDIKNFSGEEIAVDREFSRKVGDIKFNFGLGTSAELVQDQKSFVRVYSDDGAIVAQKYISNQEFRLSVQREFSSKQLYVEAVFYYCTHGERAICHIKNVVFTVPLADYPKQEDVVISYNIPESDS